ncbi:MAG: FRG domain-containing protein [Nitrospirota bacterium]
MNESDFHPEPVQWGDIGKHQDDNSIYRGHRCAGWKLETSLERASERLHDSLENAVGMEQVLLREFRRRFHHYSSQVPGPTERLRWLSLMQHHGAPTRFLDWTYSVYVAAYFALENAKDDCAIWKINKKWLAEEGKTLFEKASYSTSIFDSERDEDIEKDFQRDVISRPPLSVVVQVNPFQLDERLSIQKGIFLYPCDLRIGFEENLRLMPGSLDPKNIQKLVLSHAERPSALKILHTMNISRATLFPGLDGFAQSLKVYHPLL